MFDIVVTLVCTNEEEDIKRCLPGLMADGRDSGLNIGIVVVDNNSDKEMASSLQGIDWPLKIIRQEENLGFGRSHNRAVQSLPGRYYFILNPDTIFRSGEKLLRRLFDFMEKNPRVGIAGPRIVYPDGSLQYSCYRFPSFWQPLFSRTRLGQKGRGRKMADRFLMKDFDHQQTRPVDWVMGSAMFVRGSALEEVGGFDERYWMYAEDSDWCRRMWEKGWAVYYVAEATLEHFHRRASAKVPGVVAALLKNRYARLHLISWLKYFLKWKDNRKYYAHR